MKKIFLFLLIIIFCPFTCYAYTGSLSPDDFNINNQTVEPFSVNINANSSTNLTFDLGWVWNHSQSENIDVPGSYLFISIVSTKKLSVKRTYNFGSNCGTSCFSNDIYLQEVSHDNSSYSYVLYFNIVKWKVTPGSQTDLYEVADLYTFTNLENSSATVYLYGAYSDSTNQVPNLINDVNTSRSIIISGENNTQQILDISEQINNQLKTDCANLFDVATWVTKGNNSNYYSYSNGKLNINALDTRSYSNFTEDEKIFLPNGTYYLSNIGSANIRIYPYGNSTDVRTNQFTVTNGYIYLKLLSSTSISIEPMINSGTSALPYCSFGTSSNKIDETNDKLDDINGTIQNGDIDSPNSDFSDMEDMIAQNGVITNLISLPITLYTKILNSVNGTCSSYSFGQLFGSDITFSCISLQSLLGNTLFGVIDILFSGFTIYAIAKKMIKVFNNFSGLQEGDVIDD